MTNILKLAEKRKKKLEQVQEPVNQEQSLTTLDTTEATGSVLNSHKTPNDINKTVKKALNGSYVYSELLDDTFKLIHDKIGIKEIRFTSGTAYKWEEIEKIKDSTPEAIKQMHAVKREFKGTVI